MDYNEAWEKMELKKYNLWKRSKLTENHCAHCYVPTFFHGFLIILNCSLIGSFVLTANFKVPEVGEVFSEVTYVELPEEEAKAQVEKYRDEAKEKGYVAQTHQSKRFKSERSGSSGDRRFDDRHSSRDGRDYRDRRDHRDRDNRDSRDHRDRGSGYRPRGRYFKFQVC